MPNRELAHRVADRIENSDSFDMFNMFHEDGRPSCIAGHLLDTVGSKTRNTQPTMRDIEEVARLLGIDINKTMRLCQPMNETTGGKADVRARPGAKNYITKKMAAQALRNIADGKEPDYGSELPVIEGRAKTVN